MENTLKKLLRNLFNPAEKTIIKFKNVDTKETYKISRKELKETILAGMHYFHNTLKLQEGEVISFAFENSPEVPLLNLICLLSDLCACPLDSRRDTMQTAKEKLEETNCKVVLYRKGGRFEKILPKIAEELNIKLFAIENFFLLKKQFGEILENDDELLKRYDEEKPALILYTSGTTTKPKGAILTPKNLLAGAQQVGEWFKITPDDLFYIVLPLHHINSTTFSLATLLQGGGIILSSRYSRRSFFEDCAHLGATMSSIVPTINLDLLDEEHSFKRVQRELKIKYIQIGSAPVSPKNVKEFIKKYNIPLIQGYGSTETALRVTGIPLGLNKEDFNFLLEENSIGKPLSKNTVKIYNEKDEEITEEDVPGEICVKGDNVITSYFKRKEETKKAIKEGYFHMGDVGFFRKINNETYYFLQGRKKDIIIKGGTNISPLYIEEKIRKSVPWAKNAIVVGFPHKRLGEEIGLAIIPQNKTFQEELKALREDLRRNNIKDLSSYETPQAIITITDKETPKTSTGKIIRKKIAEIYKERFLEDYTCLGENAGITFRRIDTQKKENLKEILQIHNKMFSKGRKITFENMVECAKNGFLIGAMNKEK